MKLERQRQRIQNAINQELSYLYTSQSQRDRLFAQITGGETVKPKTRISYALVLAIVLVFISVTALAVGAIYNGYFEKLAQLDADGAMTRWETEDKIRFVNIMREYKLDMDEGDYTILQDASRPMEEREAAADRIIQARYGALVEAEASNWAEQPENLSNIAPNETIIFQERYLAEHPEGLQTEEDYVAYTDALGYYLRDVWGPAFRAQADQQPKTTPVPKGTVEDAVQMLRNYMTEVFGWHWEAVENMEPTVLWDEEYQLWQLSGEVSKASMELAFEPVLDRPTIEETENGYRLTILADTRGNFEINSLDKAAFCAKYQGVDKREEPTYEELDQMLDAGEEVAKQALKDAYALTDAQIQAMFVDRRYYTAAEGESAAYYVFRNHYMLDKQNLYGVAVDEKTNQVTDIFSFLPENMSPTWQLLHFAGEKEYAHLWYIRWPVEEKHQLLQYMKNVGMLPGHTFCQQLNPTEEETDAFVAQAFGAEGYPSAVNTWRMMLTLLGDFEDWKYSDLALYSQVVENYRISTTDSLEKIKGSTAEIGDEQAMSLVRQAFAQAWNLDEAALSLWKLQAQLVHDDYLDRGLVYWQVILTGENAEADAFHGRRNFTYRVLVDGRLMDASIMPGWYSPLQEKQVMEERLLYDNELYLSFDRYAQQNGLLEEYADFLQWPLSHQKAFADDFRMQIAEKMQQNVGFDDPRLLAFAQHIYGEQEEGMIAEEVAIRIGLDVLQQAFGFTPEEMQYLAQSTMLLDVTDEAKPFYQVGFSAEGQWTAAQRIGLLPNVYYVVEVDAFTGQVLSTYTYGEMDGCTGVDAWNRRY